MTLEQLKQQFLEKYTKATLNYNNLYESIQKEVLSLFIDYPDLVSGHVEQESLNLVFTFDDSTKAKAVLLYQKLSELATMADSIQTHVVNVIGTIHSVELVKPKGLRTTINLSMGSYLGAVTLETKWPAGMLTAAKLTMNMEVTF